MTGIYLAQLAAAVLADKGRIDAALTAASLPRLAHLLMDPPEKIKRRPLGIVSLAGSQTPTRRPQGYSETVPVTLQVELDCNEGAALAYLGVMKATMLDADYRAAVTDTRLIDWALTGSTLEDDTARRNVPSGAWRVTIAMQAMMQI